MAALLAHPETLLELVVAVVRVTARAGVRVTRGRAWLVVGLDRDVDLGHFGSLDRRPQREVAEAALVADRGREPLELRDVRRVRCEAREAHAHEPAALAHPAQQLLELVEGRAA